MSLPKYSELYLPFLTTIQDGAVYSAKEVRDRLASSLRLSDDDLSQLISSNHQTVWASRFGWANTYLKKAGLVIAPEIGHCQITDEGQRLLRSGVDITNNYLMEHYPLKAIRFDAVGVTIRGGHIAEIEHQYNAFDWQVS